MNLSKKYYINLEAIFLYSFFVVLFIPKVDLISIPGFWQGIRLEDLILMSYSLIVILNFREKIINNLLVQKFLPLLYYFIIIFISSFIGKMSGSTIVYFSLLRIIEYTILVILLCNFKISKQQFLFFIKLYVLVNIIFVLLQKFSLFGSFTSLGYLSPDHELSARVMGLAGGSWELGIIVGLCYFIIITLEKPNLSKIMFYFFIALYLNLEAQSRINFIGFVLANLFFLKGFIERKKYIVIVSAFLILCILSIIFIEFLNIDSYQRLIKTNYVQSLEIVKNFVLFFELPNREFLDETVWSLWYRLSLWSKLIPPYFDNFFTVLLGSGNYVVYYESGILRIIFTTGFIGCLYVMFMVRKLEVFIIVYFIFVGLTLDIFNSFKIFGFTMLYYKFIYENYSHRRN
tara:strand:- start:1491 stop:2696 length:1206 start_codon:yes stop_codon:yes gene_type:complete